MRIYKGIFVLAFMAALVPNVWGGIGAFLTALAVWAFVKRRDLEAWVGTGLTKKGKGEGFMAIRCGGPLSGGGSDVPADHRARAAAHGGVAGRGPAPLVGAIGRMCEAQPWK